jgi:hypothetical protein
MVATSPVPPALHLWPLPLAGRWPPLRTLGHEGSEVDPNAFWLDYAGRWMPPEDPFNLDRVRINLLSSSVLALDF